MAAYNPYNLSNSKNNLFGGSGLAASMGGKPGGVESWGGVADWSQPFSGKSNAATAVTNAANVVADTTTTPATTTPAATTTPVVDNTPVPESVSTWQPGGAAYEARMQEQLHWNDPENIAARIAQVQAAQQGPEGEQYQAWVQSNPNLTLYGVPIPDFSAWHNMQGTVRSLKQAGADNERRAALYQYDQDVARATINDTQAAMERMARADPANYSGQTYIGPVSFNYTPTLGASRG